MRSAGAIQFRDRSFITSWGVRKVWCIKTLPPPPKSNNQICQNCTPPPPPAMTIFKMQFLQSLLGQDRLSLLPSLDIDFISYKIPVVTFNCHQRICETEVCQPVLVCYAMEASCNCYEKDGNS